MPPPRLIRKSTPVVEAVVEAVAAASPVTAVVEAVAEALAPIETPPADEAPVEVEPKSRRCDKCQRKWSPPAADTCPECGGATQEE